MIDAPSSFSLPNPLHPAIVHFPLVLTLLGALLSILSVITRKGHLPHFTALGLILAAGSSHLAVLTGENQPEIFHALRPELRPLAHEHAEWGERLRTVVAVAAGLSVLALLAYRFNGVRRGLAFLTMLTAFGACYCGWEAGEHGALLVFRHGVGVQANDWRSGMTPPAQTPVPSATPQAPQTPQSGG